MHELPSDKTALTRRLLRGLEKRAAVTGESERQLAERLGSSEGLFKNLRKGSVPTVDRLHVILREIGQSLTLGSPLPNYSPAEISIKGEEFAHIPIHQAMLSAGGGAHNGQEAVIDQLAFRKDWLVRMGLAVSKAGLARVQGDSMQPTLWPGDMVLIDTRISEPKIRKKDKNDQRRAPVYALIDDDEARVKRIERPSEDVLMLISDNPDYSPEFRQGSDLNSIQIIGKVVWWGHTVKD